jgi:urease accessory protein
MLSVNKLIPQGRGLAAVLLKRAASVELDWDVRQKSRFDATDSSGRALGVFLSRGAVVRGGDVLVAEDGSLIVVKAAAQPVMVVRHCAEHGSPHDLLRAAYHLGNRHVQLELQADRLLLEPDHVLAGMLEQRGTLAVRARGRGLRRRPRPWRPCARRARAPARARPRAAWPRSRARPRPRGR